MSELLAPAGSMEALRAAIANGCDAVYLGMQKFGARAYSANFSEQELAEAVAYAHIRGVKVYVTVNTIVFQDELEDVYRQLHFLNGLGVDGVIAQDLAVLTYVARNFCDMEAHCSTQMGIDDLEGALLAKELGAKRAVISREVPLEQVKRIREQADLPVEVFVHGALCISYSGNCIMSSMTGNRSGNRGRCIGSCRKLYDFVDLGTGKSLGKSYILSTKDLNTIQAADDFTGIDSLKIEGRMRGPEYVANVVSRCRMALDGRADADDLQKLDRTFNRTYTKGYLLHEDKEDIVNPERPNNHGFRIGTVARFKKGMYQLALEGELNQNDVIRIRHGNEDVNLSVAKIYDQVGKLINGSSDTCFIKVKECLAPGDVVYKTKDVRYMKQLESQLTGEFRRFPLDVTVHAHAGAPLVVDAGGLGCTCTYVGDTDLDAAVSKPTTLEGVEKQFGKLNETVFSLGKVCLEGRDGFIPVKMLNEARRCVVEALYSEKLSSKPRGVVKPEACEPICFEPAEPFLCAQVATQEQYDACRECGIGSVYFGNVVPRNGSEYRDREGELLLGGLGGVYRYRDSNPFVTDYSMNVVNAKSCYELHRLGAKRVTLSYEVNRDQLACLLDVYRRENGGLPSLEMIVYGHAPLLVTKYCPLEKMGQCGSCRKKRYEIRDEHGSFPIMPHANCNTTVLNGKVLNLLDEMPGIEGVQAFRLNFTIEKPDEVRRVVRTAQAKLRGEMSESAFNPQTDTRGLFNREIM